VAGDDGPPVAQLFMESEQAFLLLTAPLLLLRPPPRAFPNHRSLGDFRVGGRVLSSSDGPALLIFNNFFRS
jgi:hypothetical protein